MVHAQIEAALASASVNSNLVLDQPFGTCASGASTVVTSNTSFKPNAIARATVVSESVDLTPEVRFSARLFRFRFVRVFASAVVASAHVQRVHHRPRARAPAVATSAHVSSAGGRQMPAS